MKELTTTISDDLYQALRVQAVENGRSVEDEALAVIMERLEEVRNEALLRANKIVKMRD